MTSTASTLDTIINEGECVYSLCWDTGGPGSGAGVERVYRLNDLYAVCLDDDDEHYGPYRSLPEAVKAHEQLCEIGPATSEIVSIELDVAAIEALLVIDQVTSEPCKVRINGVICSI